MVRLRPAHGEDATRTPLIVMEAGKRKSLTSQGRNSQTVEATSFAKEWESHRPVVGAPRIARSWGTCLPLQKRYVALFCFVHRWRCREERDAVE